MDAATLWRDVQAATPAWPPTRRPRWTRGWKWTKRGCPSADASSRWPWSVYGPVLDASGLDRQHMQRTMGRHIRNLDPDTLTHLDRALLPVLRRLARERPVAAGPILLELWQAIA